MSGRIFGGLLLALYPAIAAAQAPAAPGLPFITVEGAIGGIRTPHNSGATFYRSRALPLGRVALAVRLGSRGSFRPVAVLDYFDTFSQGDQVTDCPLTPNGTCGQYFPDVVGVSAGFGVRRTMGTDITVGLTAGVGRYEMVTGLDAERLTGFHVSAEAALRFARHVGVVLKIGHIETGEYRSARMWYQPVTFGLRVQ